MGRCFCLLVCGQTNCARLDESGAVKQLMWLMQTPLRGWEKAHLFAFSRPHPFLSHPVMFLVSPFLRFFEVKTVKDAVCSGLVYIIYSSKRCEAVKLFQIRCVLSWMIDRLCEIA